MPGWLGRRILAACTEAQFYGNEWASAAMLLGILLSFALNPLLPFHGSGLTPQLLTAQILTVTRSSPPRSGCCLDSTTPDKGVTAEQRPFSTRQEPDAVLPRTPARPHPPHTNKEIQPWMLSLPATTPPP
jgi:hypothetical protein